MVAVDDETKPVKARGLICETPDEKKRFEDAKKRREQRKTA
jgi:acyl-CoA hydrolase